MALFQKKNKVIEVGGQKIELQPKPKKGIFSIFSKQQNPKAAQPSKPPQPSLQQPVFTPKQPTPQQAKQPEMQMPKSTMEAQPQPQKQEDVNKIEADFGRQQTQQKSAPGKGGSPLSWLKGAAPKTEQKQTKPQAPRLEFPSFVEAPKAERRAPGAAAAPATPGKPRAKQNAFEKYVEKTASKQKGLEAALHEAGIKGDMVSFVRRMILLSIALSVLLGIVVFVFFSAIGLTTIEAALFGGVLALGIFQTAQKSFLQYPLAKEKNTAKNVERDILFAARDLIISLRSGMPLFNALTSVSSGYGDASKEFAKIVDRVQLGMPLEDAIDDTIAQTKSASFRRIMLQASVSIKAGADVVSALQSIIEQLSQERIIELRSYGQKLNAIAMFYMLFGVILPSMGIAVVTILTTFIALFTVNVTVFEFVLIGIIGLQVIFLKLITGSRPVFSM